MAGRLLSGWALVILLLAAGWRDTSIRPGESQYLRT